MHALRRADDGVDRARFDAQRASDADRFVDAGECERMGLAAAPIQRDALATGDRCERRDERVASGRAAIDRRARGDGVRVRTAAVIAALFALHLRQHGVDRVGKRT